MEELLRSIGDFLRLSGAIAAGVLLGDLAVGTIMAWRAKSQQKKMADRAMSYVAAFQEKYGHLLTETDGPPVVESDGEPTEG